VSDYTPGPLAIWGQQSKTEIGGFTVIGRPDMSGACTAYVANVADAMLYATAPDLLSIAKRWAALDAGGWHPDRCASDKAALIVDTLAAIAKAEGK